MPSPGTNAIVEITTQLLLADLPRDWCTCNLSFNTLADPADVTAHQALTDAIAGVWFHAATTYTSYFQSGGKVISYDRAALKPRPEMGVTLHTPGTWAGSITMPRQISLRVSMFSGRNLKRRRGGPYLPYNLAWSSSERPSTTIMNNAMGLLVAIQGAAAALSPSWNLTVHSDKDSIDYPVDNFWVDDVWDVQRRRGLKSTTRVHHP